MKKILDHLRLDWYKYVLEILVITFGILGAFALNNWNESSKNKKEEQRILMDLKQEFLRNKENAKNNIELNDKSIITCYRIIEMNRNNEFHLDPFIQDSMLAITFSWGSFDAQLSVTNEIINTGRISLIRDDVLKNKITGWNSILINASEDYKSRLDHFDLVVIPWFNSRTPMTNFDKHIPWSYWLPGFKPPELLRVNYNWSEINPLEFENIIWGIAFHNNYVVMNEQIVLNYCEQILALIEKSQTQSM